MDVPPATCMETLQQHIALGASYSSGMVLAAGSGDNEIYLLEPDAGAKPGMQIK